MCVLKRLDDNALQVWAVSTRCVQGAVRVFYNWLIFSLYPLPKLRRQSALRAARGTSEAPLS